MLPGGSHHGVQCRPSGVGQKRSAPVSDGQLQHTLAFCRPLIRSLQQAPAKLVRQCDSPRRAMRLALKLAGMKRLACARMLGISESYLCRLVNQRQPMPDWFVPAFCWATGSLLLQQYLDTLDDSEATIEARIVAEFSQQSRSAA